MVSSSQPVRPSHTPAMILAAGRGERMRPLSDHTPKPLLAAGGKRLIEWQIERLVQAGVQRIVINHAWLGEQIPATLGDGSRYGAQFAYSDEGTALETAGGIARALPLLNSDYFMVTNGDVYCDFPYATLLARQAAMQANDLQAWLVLVPNPPHHPQGDFTLQHEAIVDAETVAAATSSSLMGKRYTFSGIALYHRRLFSQIGLGASAKLAPLLRAAITQGQVGGELFTGTWVDVGTPARLSELDLLLKNNVGHSQQGNLCP